MSWLELVATFLGICNIILLVRRSIWNYAFGLGMVTLYAPIFFVARLYSDALLQVFFFAVQLYGWWNWRRSASAADGTIVVEQLSWPARARWAAAALAATIAWGWLMHRWTNAVYPFLDAANAILSITAQIMLARRLVENWLLWVVVDMIAIRLYLARGLLPTAGLYVLFLLLSGWGWAEWTEARRKAARLANPVPPA